MSRRQQFWMAIFPTGLCCLAAIIMPLNEAVAVTLIGASLPFMAAGVLIFQRLNRDFEEASELQEKWRQEGLR